MDKVDTIPDRIEHLKPSTVPMFALRSLQIVPNGYGEGELLYSVTRSAVTENRQKQSFCFA